MTFWQKNKWKIIAPVLIVLVLAAAFVFGDRDMPKQKDTSEQPTVAAPVETPEQPTTPPEGQQPGTGGENNGNTTPPAQDGQTATTP